MMLRLLVCAFVCVLLLGCDSPGTEYLQTDNPRLDFAARRASPRPVPGWEKVETPGSAFFSSEDVLYLSPDIELTNADIQSTGVEKRGPDGSWLVVLHLGERAKRRFADLSSDMADEPREMLAVLVEGKIASAPTVVDPVTDGVLRVGGTFSESEEEARKIAKGIVGD